ncbi:uncharacterized protein LOC108742844 [Caligus rogercresseyi]|uniref:Uncharacterized protein LOC108742844 n=1 Tax=Caligus rogercresseyi TaxID=217165 RepID=A0A7T8JY47_CALRO|nr:uncharacterized protein LOC108742844 [Caligus rogercresseyi]
MELKVDKSRKTETGPQATHCSGVGGPGVLTIVDRFTRWPEALQMEDMGAETVARTFLKGGIAV